MNFAQLVFAAGTGAALTAPGLTAAASPVLATAPDVAQEAFEKMDLFERLVGWLHGFFPGVDEILFHGIACLVIIAAAILLRHVIAHLIFHRLRKLAQKTETTFDDRIFAALEPPVSLLVMVCGIWAGLTVLKASFLDRYIHYGAPVALTGVILWCIMCAGDAIIDHLQELARRKGLGIAAFMPLIKKGLAALFAIFGLLVLAQSLGADVKAFLAGLGIGGLAFALAAQDTLANVFGSFVIAVDQPFRVGESVTIGANEGTVEDIGLRSTKLRTGARTLVVIPNKTVAGEAIVNLSRMPQRRVDLTVGLTYETQPGQMEAVLEYLRKMLNEEPGVDRQFTVVNFVNFGASSLDIQIVYFAADPDWRRHLGLRERVNLKIMRAVAAHGLAFAFPSQTVHLDGEVVRKLAAGKA
jgi:MscS family membrane protein